MALEAFKEIDVDGDGQVSKAEFVKIMSKFDYIKWLNFISITDATYVSDAKVAGWQIFLITLQNLW